MSRLEQINASHIRAVMRDQNVGMNTAKRLAYRQAARDDITEAQTVDDLKPLLFWLFGENGPLV